MNGSQMRDSQLKGQQMEIGIIVAEFNSEVTKKMLEAASAEAKKQGVFVSHIVRVPGVLEIPLALKKLLGKKSIQGVATLGAVIQGQSEHDRLVAFTATEKILSLSLEYNKPVSLGISGPRITKKQALARAKEYGQRSILTLKNLSESLQNL